MGNETRSKGYAFDNANKLTLEGNLASPGANGNIQYTWDSNGSLTKKNIIGDGFTEYRYDANNHMTKLNDGVTLTFAYNGDGARFSKDDGTTMTKFVFDRRTGTPGLDPVLIETDSGGTTTARYTNGSTSLTTGEGGLIAQKRSSTTSYYHFEAIGTTRQLTNSSETATDSYTMDAWGNSLASSGSTTNPFRYVGRENYYRDSESGLMRLGVREYDAAVGRFASHDPEQGGLNWHQYVENRPLTSTDPMGLRSAIPPSRPAPPPTSGKNFDYYDYMCKLTGDHYHCGEGKRQCETFCRTPPHRVDTKRCECIRKCLQDSDYKKCIDCQFEVLPPKVCGPPRIECKPKKGYQQCCVDFHEDCFTKCNYWPPFGPLAWSAIREGCNPDWPPTPEFVVAMM